MAFEYRIILTVMCSHYTYPCDFFSLDIWLFCQIMEIIYGHRYWRILNINLIKININVFLIDILFY